MGKAKRVIRCHCCGAILQYENKKETGYISKEVLESSPKIPYCNSCYKKMLEINSSELDENVEKDISKILDDAVATDALVIWVVDSFSYNGTLNHEIVRKVKKLDTVVIGTKSDLFDDFCNEDILKEFITNTFKEVGIEPVGVLLMKNNKEYDFTELRNKLDNIRQGHDVYLIGNYSSGKTTLINRFLKSYVNKSKRSVTTIVYPETNSNVLEIPLSNSSFFYELPDLPIHTSILSKIGKDLVKYVIPHKTIKMDKKTLTVGESIALGNLAFYSLVKGAKTNFKFYAAEGVEYKKIKASKINEYCADDIAKKHTRPVSESFNSFIDFDVFDYEMENDGKWHDIGVEGLCWASFIAKGQVIRVSVPKGTALKEFISKVNN